MYESEVETPRNDASYGLLLVGDGRGDFTVVPPQKSGIHVPGEIRVIAPLDTTSIQPRLLVARNEDELVVVERRRTETAAASGLSTDFKRTSSPQ